MTSHGPYRAWRVANAAHEAHHCNSLAAFLRGPYDWFHSAALRRWNHPRNAGICRGVITQAQATDAGSDDPRVEHGVYRWLSREYCAARDPAGASRGRRIDAMDRQRLLAAAWRAGAGRRLGRRSLRPPAGF